MCDSLVRCHVCGPAPRLQPPQHRLVEPDDYERQYTPAIYMSTKKYESRGVTKPRYYRRRTRLHILVKMVVPLLFLLLTAVMRGQSALDGFDPNANGIVHVFVVQPDGKVLIGGEFTTLSPNGGAAVTRNGIARLNPDGTLDTAFDPNANDIVVSIAVQADGKILAGGFFTSIGGQMRNRIARLDATTGLADSFDPNANVFVGSIAVQADGKILAGGAFASIGGQPRNRIARLDATTGAADSFDPNANSVIYSIAVQADGKILAGGAFSGANSIGGQTRNGIARLDATTGLADSFDPNANGLVESIAVQADGKILAGGNFAFIGGQARSNIARLDATTGLADSFDPNANGSGSVVSIALQADGEILAGGFFTSMGGQTRNRIARLDATTGLADSFDPNANNDVDSIVVQVDGRILVGGAFTTLAPNGGAAVTRNRIARLIPTLAPTPTPSPTPAAQATNLSTRMRVQTGDNVGIGGFIITGSAPKHVLLRAIGPSLAQFGVPDVLADPVLELHGPGAFVTITDDNWRDDPMQEALIIADGIPPTNDLESAIDATLAPGAYTAIVRGKNNTSGVALVEVYDLSQAVPAKLADISTRAFVSTGDNIVIAGFTLGSNSGDDRIVARGIGPSLTAAGVPNALADPTLELRDSNGALLFANNNWQDDPAQAAELTAAGLAPTNNLESGIAATLSPGLYTALLAGLSNGTGVGVVEVYDLGAP